MARCTQSKVDSYLSNSAFSGVSHTVLHLPEHHPVLAYNLSPTSNSPPPVPTTTSFQAYLPCLPDCSPILLTATLGVAIPPTTRPPPLRDLASQHLIPYDTSNEPWTKKDHLWCIRTMAMLYRRRGDVHELGVRHNPAERTPSSPAACSRIRPIRATNAVQRDMEL